MHALLDVHEEQDDVAFGDGQLNLRADGPAQGVVGTGGHASRIDQPETLPVPFHRAEVAIPRDAWEVIHDRLPAADNPVE